MRYYRSFLLPFLPNPFSYVEVSGGTVSLFTLGTKNYSLPANEVSPDLDPAGFFGLFGCGEIALNFGGRVYKTGKLTAARALRRRLEQTAKIRISMEVTGNEKLENARISGKTGF